MIVVLLLGPSDSWWCILGHSGSGLVVRSTLVSVVGDSADMLGLEERGREEKRNDQIVGGDMRS
jgi:hypothetical protein